MCNETCLGLFINESMPKVHMSFYADDVAMVNAAIGRLQRRLNVMSEFSSKYGLSINMYKIKCYDF